MNLKHIYGSTEGGGRYLIFYGFVLFIIFYLKKNDMFLCHGAPLRLNQNVIKARFLFSKKVSFYILHTSIQSYLCLE